MAIYHINRAQSIAERLLKLRDYLYINASPTHAVKASDILTYLANEGHEVEIKTVYSDLKTLEIHFGLDLHYDGRQRGYLLNNPPFAPYELREIVNSVQAAKFITQEEADRLTAKIMGLADKYTRQSLNRKTFVHNRVRSFNDAAMQGLDTIYEAIAEDRKISYKYFHQTMNGNQAKKYATVDGSKIIVTSPYGVSWNGEHFTILAVRQRTGKDNLYFLRLDRMEQVKILAERREGWETAKKLINAGFSGVPKNRSYMQTKLKVATNFIPSAIEKFGNDIVAIPIDAKFSAVTINAAPTPEIYLWMRKFHPCIEILFPEDAEQKLRNYFSEIAKGNHVLPPYV